MHNLAYAMALSKDF